MFYICFGVNCCRPNRCCYGATPASPATTGCGCFANTTPVTSGCGCFANTTPVTSGCGCFANTTPATSGYGCYANTTARNKCCCSNLGWNGTTFYSATDTTTATDIYTTRACCNRCNNY